jgi:hypothetical protein
MTKPNLENGQLYLPPGEYDIKIDENGWSAKEVMTKPEFTPDQVKFISRQIREWGIILLSSNSIIAIDQFYNSETELITRICGETDGK